MLISERFETDGDKLVHVRQHDFTPVLNRAAMLRSEGHVGVSEHWHIGTVPMALVSQWLTEAGVSWDDHAARQEVIKRKLLDGEFAKLRVHEGTF